MRRERVSQIANHCAVQNRVVCPPGGSKFAMCWRMLFKSLNDKLSCTSFQTFLTPKQCAATCGCKLDHTVGRYAGVETERTYQIAASGAVRYETGLT